MKIAPLSTSDPWLGRILEDRESFAQGLRGVPVESTVEVDLVEVLHGRPEENYRPYLHIRGEVIGVRPSVELPYGVDELSSRRGSGTRVDAFYEFDHRQLQELVSKGYFTEGFQAPDALASVPWELPMEADFVIVGPRTAEEVPIVFMGLSSAAGLDIDQASSGYDLSAYFPDFTAEPEAEEQVEVEEGLSRDGSGRDLFADDDLSNVVHIEERLAQAREAAAGPVAPERVFDRLVDEVAATIPLPEQLEEEEVFESEPTEADVLYATSVAPGVDRAIAGDHSVSEEPLLPEAEAGSGSVSDDLFEDEPVYQDDDEQVEDVFADDEPDAEDEELAPEPIRVEPEEPSTEEPEVVDKTDVGTDTSTDAHRDVARARRERSERIRLRLAQDEAEQQDQDSHEFS